MSTASVMIVLLVVGVPVFAVLALMWVALAKTDRFFEKEKQ